LELTHAQEERSRKLHFESFVFDFSPHGEPIVLTPRVRAAMEEEICAKKRLSKILRRMWLERLAETYEDAKVRAELRGIWDESGVNGMQATLGGMELDIRDWDALVRDVARWHRRTGIGDDLVICTSASQLRHAWEQRRIGVMLGLQDTLPIGTDLDRLATLYGLGVRVVQLTYNRRNLVGDGCTEREQSGLSAFGLDLVKELNRLGIAVDVSHSGYRTTIDAIEVSERPIAFTHVACKAVNDHPRAKSDEELRRVAEVDGYVGIVAVPFFLRSDGEADINDMMDHIEHAVKLVGLRRVGIATDWGFWSTDFPRELYEATLDEFASMGFRPEDGLVMNAKLGDFVRWEDWPHITRGLVSRNFNDDEIRGLLGENWLLYLDRAGIHQ
jgi:membrane dipeptidase